MEKKANNIHIQEIMFMYSIVDTINRFCHGIRFSIISRKEDVKIETCLEIEIDI